MWSDIESSEILREIQWLEITYNGRYGLPISCSLETKTFFGTKPFFDCCKRFAAAILIFDDLLFKFEAFIILMVRKSLTSWNETGSNIERGFDGFWTRINFRTPEIFLEFRNIHVSAAQKWLPEIFELLLLMTNFPDDWDLTTFGESFIWMVTLLLADPAVTNCVAGVIL